MSASSDESRIEQLVEDYIERKRRGEKVSVKEYVEQHPDLAEPIRETFDALALMEDLAPDPGESLGLATDDFDRPALGTNLEQLGDYRIIREIGRGGMGVVYEAEQISLGRHVALKVLSTGLMADSMQKRRFAREARAAANLHHTNIVPVYGVGEHQGTHYYAMQFIQGLGLDEVLVELRRLRREKSSAATKTVADHRDDHRLDVSAADVAQSLLLGSIDLVQPETEVTQAGPDLTERHAAVQATMTDGSAARKSTIHLRDSDTLSLFSSSVVLPGRSEMLKKAQRRLTYWRSVARIGVQVAEALDYAHSQGVLHRDVKPSNLLLDAAGDVWVADFGLAKIDSDDNLTQEGDIIGTLRYMAPESFKGKSTSRSDVYSLGLTLYEMLAFRPAFDKSARNEVIQQVMAGEVPPLVRVNAGVPRDLATVVHKATDRDPAHRYQSAGELAADLERFIRDEPIHARRVSLAERFIRWSRRNKAIAASLGTIAALLVVGVVGLALASSRFRSDALAQEELARQKEVERGKAVEAQEEAERLRKEEAGLRMAAVVAQQKTETTLTEMHTARGLVAAQMDRPAEALLWFANAARMAADDSVRQQSNRVRFRTWSRQVTTPVRALSHDGKRLIRLKFQPGGDLLFTLDAERRLRVWDWLQEKPLVWADGHEAVWSQAWSPDGRHLAVGLDAGGVEIRRVRDGEVLHRIDHPGRVTALAYSRGGDVLAVGSTVVRIWDTRRHDFTNAQWKHRRQVVTLGFNAAGDRVVTGCNDDTARVYDVSAKEQDTSPVLGPVDHLMTFSPIAPVFVDEDRRVVTATARGPVVWNIDEGTSIATRSLNWQRRGSVAASGDGKMFVASGHGQAGIFRADGTSVATLPHHHILPTLAISPDDSTVLVASFDRVATLWSIAGEPLETLPHQSPVSHVDFSSDGRYLVTGQIDGLVRVWRRPKGTPGDRLLPYQATGFATPELKFGPEGRLGIVSSYRWHNMALRETTVRVFDLTKAKQIGPDLPLRGRLRDAALSPDGKTAAAVNISAARGELRVWDIRSGRDSFAPLVLPDVPDGVTFHPSGDRVAVLCRGGQLLFVDALTGKKSLEVQLHASQDRAQSWRTLGSVEFTADGSTLVALRPFDVSVLDAQTGKLRFEPIKAPTVEAGQSVNFTEVQISHDGRLLAASLHLESKGTVQVFDIATGQPLCDPLPHADGVYRVRFSPDDRHLLTACSDNEARLWNWRTGRLVCPPSRHDDGVYGVGFTPNGRWMITASRDNTLRVWDARTGRPVAPPRKLNNPFNDGARFLAITPDGRHAITNGSDDEFLMVDLSDLYGVDDSQDIDELVTRAELVAGQRVFDADVSGLTVADWLARWKNFRREHPEDGAPTEEATVERHRLAAMTWLDRGRPDAALVHARRLSELQPNEVMPWRIAARVFYDRGEWDRVAKSLNRAIQAAPDDPTSLALATALHLRRAESSSSSTKDRQQATAYLRRLLDNPRTSPDELDQLADLLADRPSVWQPLQINGVLSEKGATLTLLDDNSILAGGANPNSDTYTVIAASELDGITALRLDLLPDASFVNNGPGRSSYGRCALSEIRASGRGEDGLTAPLQFDAAVATGNLFQYHVNYAIDGDRRTGWLPRSFGTSTAPISAIFRFAKPLSANQARDLFIELDCASWSFHNLGRFRLMVTRDPHPRDQLMLSEVVAGRTTARSRLAAALLLSGHADLATAVAHTSPPSIQSTEMVAPAVLAIARARKDEKVKAMEALEQAVASVDRGAGTDTLRRLVVLAASHAIERWPEEPRLWVLRGIALSKRLKYGAADEDFAQALELNSDDVATLVRRAQLNVDRSKFDLALASYNQAAALPNDDLQLAAKLERLKILLVSDVIVPPDSTWKWLHPTDGVDPATSDEDFHLTFFRADFDDSAWNTGQDSPGTKGGFGYKLAVGNDIGKPRNLDDRKTAYFRHEFTTQKAMETLSIRMQRDDGVIVYLDGQEMARDNIPDGEEAYDLYATQLVNNGTGQARSSQIIRLPGILQPGEHVLAISLHNREGGSSDLRIAEISLNGTPRE